MLRLQSAGSDALSDDRGRRYWWCQCSVLSYLGRVISWKATGTRVSLTVPSLVLYYFQLSSVHLRVDSYAFEVRAQLTLGLVLQRCTLTRLAIANYLQKPS